MEDVYKTIETPAEGLYKEKGSKFIAFAYPVRTEEAVKEIVEEIKVRYYDARHHCYAYRLGADKKNSGRMTTESPLLRRGNPFWGRFFPMI